MFGGGGYLVAVDARWLGRNGDESPSEGMTWEKWMSAVFFAGRGEGVREAARDPTEAESRGCDRGDVDLVPYCWRWLLVCDRGA